jgi:CubicO group peptidase (beta-lactamase class C family)
MRYVACLIILFLIFSCAEQPQTNQILKIDGSSISRNKLSDRIQSLVDSAEVTGISIIVFNQDTVAYQEAFGYSNLEEKDSLRLNHIFYGASLSKAVFGYIVARLSKDGLIDLDKPLQDYLDEPLPEIAFQKEWKGFQDLTHDDRYKSLTARMCLSHTTGFPNWRWISRTGEFQPEGKLQFYFDPGTDYSYSGEGINLLQFVVEKITEKDLEQLARELVFIPFEMNMTSYVWQDRFENNYCYGHTSEGQLIPKDKEDEPGAAGSMETTPIDYAKFLAHVLGLSSHQSEVTKLLFKPNIKINSKQQFGPESLEKTNQNENIVLNYGLGWGILNSPFGNGYFKEGHSEGFQHYSILFPEKRIGILIMSNSDNAESIFKEVLELAIGDKFTPWEWENYIPYDRKN